MKIFFVWLLFIPVTWAQHNHGASAPAASVAPQVDRREEPRVPIHVPQDQQQKIGLKTEKVQKKNLLHNIRTVGTITADQTREYHIHTRISGWIERIFTDYVGKSVQKGAPLYELYSPELVSTQEEYLAAIKQPGVGKELAKAALDRLKLWEVPQSAITKMTKSGRSSRTITFESPVSGVVISKTAIQGMYINPGMELYQISDLSNIWIQITLYEFDVSIVKVGDEVTVQLPYEGNRSFKAKISFISPDIDPQTRTAKARIEIANKDQSLKPNMYANVFIKKTLGDSIVVPDDAVIDTGLRKIVFVRSEGTMFEPRELQLGPRVEGQFVVLEGLKTGDEIVTSAHFLIDAESKLKASLGKGAAHQHGSKK